MEDLKQKYKKEKIISKKITFLGEIIDEADKIRNLMDLDFAIGHCNKLLEKEYRQLNSEEITILNYYLGIAWGDVETYMPFKVESTLRNISTDCTVEETIEKSLLGYRSALIEDGFNTIKSTRQVQIYTNIANLLSHSGRIIEALEYWDKALSLSPHFTMAEANRVLALDRYASLLYDLGHKNIFYMQVANDYRLLKRDNYITDEHWNYFEQQSERFAGFRKNKFPQIDWNDFSLGLEEEKEYREWALHNHLFLNPLNDIKIAPLSARDPMHLPSIVVKVGTGAVYQGMFNQIKQEYVSARFLLFEGINKSDTHYSDRDVYIVNTLDYVASSINIEKVKLAYRSVFSIFDKVGFFLNKYYELGIKDSDTHLLSKTREKIRITENYDMNWILKGIEWLFKDVFEERFEKYLDPDSQLIRTIRNQIEHKYLKVLDLGDYFGYRDNKSKMVDDLAYNIPRHDFNEKALKLLKLARALLMYLPLAIKIDQEIKRESRDPMEIIPPMLLGVVEDDWKR